MTRSVNEAAEVGPFLARLHWQCWRAVPPPLEIDLADLAAALPILIRSGSVGLVWPRIRDQIDPGGAIALALEAAYRAQALHNETCQREIAQSVTRLRQAGIEPLLVKGWAVSRRYPSPLVRPAGDIDLIVRHEDYRSAARILNAPDAPPITVGLDLQDVSTWPDRTGDDGWLHAERIEVAGVEVLVPGAEDHLRLLCHHFLRHGAVRPSRLSDIAVLLEGRGSGFDWDRCLGTYPVSANWIVTALGLAHRFQGAEIGGTPASGMGDALPGWLLAVASDRLTRPQDDPSDAFGQLARDPRQFAAILRRRWPDPVSATLRYPAPFGSPPRLPLQWVVYLRQIGGYLRFRLAPQVRRVRSRRGGG